MHIIFIKRFTFLKIIYQTIWRKHVKLFFLKIVEVRKYHKVSCFSEFPVQFYNNTTFIISHMMSFHNKYTLEFWVMYDTLAHDLFLQ